MNKQRKVLITITYNEMGVIIDTKTVELGSSAQPEPCEDTISRQAAIDALRNCYDTETVTMDNGDEYINYNDAVGEIEQLPPAQPERIRGRWVKGYDGRHAVCSNCEAWWIPFGEGYKADYHFCPNCGAKMEGDAE